MIKSIAPTRRSAGRLILGALVALGVVAALIRYVAGLGAISNLSDAYPWGIWISFDLLCGVALAAGAFTTAAAVHLLRVERLHPILRPAILTGFLGYLMVILALLVDLGRPEHIFNLVFFWNPHSVLFEVGWCVMTYTAVLALEFSPVVFERLGWRWPLSVMRHLTIVFVVLGTVLSTLHQSSLGSLFLAMPSKVNPLWFSPFLPFYFFLTAVSVGPAMVIVEGSISARAFGRAPETHLLADLARAIPVTLGLYVTLKLVDLTISGEWARAFRDPMAPLFWLELLAGAVLPAVLFSLPAVRRSGPRLLGAASLVIAGLVLNRFDVSLIGWARPMAGWYAPHWLEIAVTVGILAAGVSAYAFVARFLPLFEAHGSDSHAAIPSLGQGG